jgi:hypothetical protein
MLAVKKLLSVAILSVSLLISSASVYATGLVELTIGVNVVNASVTAVNYAHTSSMSSIDVLPYDYENVISKPILPSFLASDGFSNVQGKNNWYYQFWNGSSYSNMSFDSTNNAWLGTYPNLVSSTGQHPGVSTDSVRKWVAPQSGTINITGNVAKSDLRSGDGVSVKVLKNSTNLWSALIAYNDGVGRNIDVTTNVVTGDAIYFILNRNGSELYDSTNWNPKIAYK